MTTDGIEPEGRAPFVRGSDTSEAAADAIEGHRPRMLARVLAALKQAHPSGLTDQEMQGLLSMGAQTQGPRRIELVRLGLVIDSGGRRKTRSGRYAVVWVYQPRPE